MYGKKWWLVLLALAGGAFLALLWARPAVAQVGLNVGEGDAVWFSGACSDSDNLAITAPVVAPDPADPGRKTLHIQLDDGYPGYEFTCALYFANSGQISLWVKSVSVANPHPGAVSVAAAQPAAEVGNTIDPCPVPPVWGDSPAGLPAACRAEIQLSVRVEEGAEENAGYGYSVEITLESVVNPVTP